MPSPPPPASDPPRTKAMAPNRSSSDPRPPSPPPQLTALPLVDVVRAQPVDEQGARVLLGDDDQAGGVGLLKERRRGGVSVERR